MKTIQQLKDSIYLNSTKNQKEKIKFLILFLETKPNEELLLKRKLLIEKTIKNTELQYHYWLDNVSWLKENKESKKVFNDETGVTKLKQYLKTLNYLLK